MSIFDNRTAIDWLAKTFTAKLLRKNFLAHAYSESEVKDGVINFVIGSRVMPVPIDFEVEVVAQVLQVNIVTDSIEYRIVVAVGGVFRENSGIVSSRYFDAKMLYNEDISLYPVDLMESW